MKKMKLFPVLIAVLILFVFAYPVSAGLIIKPANAKLVAGGTQLFTVTSEDQDGNPITSTITWYSDNNSVATIPSTGLEPCCTTATATGIGETTVTASSGSVSVSAKVTVIGLGTSSGNLENIISVDLNTLPIPPIGSNLPYGIFSFENSEIPEKSSVTHIWTAPNDLPAWTTYLKYNYKTKTWNSITPDEINGKIIKITFTDGGTGDDDGEANGIIHDPGGINIGQIPAIPEFTTIALPVIALIGLMLLFQRRKGK